MKAPPARPVRRLWAWAPFAVLGASILATADVAVDISLFLFQRNLLRVGVTVAAIAVLLALIDRLAFVTRPRKWLAWCGLLLGLALLARELIQQQAKRDASEALHCVEFLVLTLLAGQALAMDLRSPWWIPAAALTVALFGLLDELVQGLHPLRHFDPSDVLLDARVALYGMLMLPALARRAQTEAAGAPAPRAHPDLAL